MPLILTEEQAMLKEAADGFLNENAPIAPKDRDELKVLLDVFLLEKALYELAYELNNRPSWLPIPLRGIREILSFSPFPTH